MKTTTLSRLRRRPPSKIPDRPSSSQTAPDYPPTEPAHDTHQPYQAPISHPLSSPGENLPKHSPGLPPPIDLLPLELVILRKPTPHHHRFVLHGSPIQHRKRGVGEHPCVGRSLWKPVEHMRSELLPRYIPESSFEGLYWRICFFGLGSWRGRRGDQAPCCSCWLGEGERLVDKVVDMLLEWLVVGTANGEDSPRRSRRLRLGRRRRWT